MLLLFNYYMGTTIHIDCIIIVLLFEKLCGYLLTVLICYCCRCLSSTAVGVQLLLEVPHCTGLHQRALLSFGQHCLWRLLLLLLCWCLVEWEVTWPSPDLSSTGGQWWKASSSPFSYRTGGMGRGVVTGSACIMLHMVYKRSHKWTRYLPHVKNLLRTQLFRPDGFKLCSLSPCYLILFILIPHIMGITVLVDLIFESDLRECPDHCCARIREHVMYYITNLVHLYCTLWLESMSTANTYMFTCT